MADSVFATSYIWRLSGSSCSGSIALPAILPIVFSSLSMPPIQTFTKFSM